MMHDVIQQAKPTFGSQSILFNAYAKDEVVVGQVIKEIYQKCLYQNRTIIVRLFKRCLGLNRTPLSITHPGKVHFTPEDG